MFYMLDSVLQKTKSWSLIIGIVCIIMKIIRACLGVAFNDSTVTDTARKFLIR